MFITFEGPEGSGKTSQIDPLAEYLRHSGQDVCKTREPGGTPIGDDIRNVLTNMKNEDMHPRTEILLFQASRAQLVEQVIRPALQENKIVLCDRYADSTLAYQGYGHQIDLAKLRSLIEFATGGLTPDMTFLLDIDVETGLRRKSSGGEWNRLDAYAIDFHRRVRDGYHKLAEEDPRRWIVVDASQPYDIVQVEIRRHIMKLLQKRA